MKLGQVDYRALLTKLKDERDNMRDYLTNTKNLAFHTDENGTSRMTIETANNTVAQYGITELAERQLAERLKIPTKYYDYMKTNQPTLLDNNVNTWLQEKPEKRFVRTLHGNVRAFLSDRYQRIDNLEIALKALQVLNENKDFTTGSLEVTENHLYIKVISERFTDEIAKGDAVQAGFVVSNSEVGLGCVKIEPLIYRLVCTNGMILPDRMHKKYHVGQRQSFEDDYAIEMFRAETIETSNKAYLMKVEDILRGALNERIFRDTVAKMRKANEVTIDVDPVETVKALGENMLLTEAERIKISANYMNDENFTQYGLANAVTKTANTTADYERATELERMGGYVLDMDIETMLKNVDGRSKKNKKLF